MRMRMFARVELHGLGEIHNAQQLEELGLLRARLAALEEAEFQRRRQAVVVETTTTPPLPTTTTTETADGDASQEDLPF